jgi:hypothetical protein
MFKSTLNIINMNNITLDFNESLTIKNSINLKYCHNIKIINKSKINKIIIEKCNNISIDIKSLVNGIEINKSNKIIINSKENNMIPIIELYKSSVYIVGPINHYKDIKINSEQSELYNIN